MGRFWVHFEGKADITGYQIRCRRVWEVWEEADCSEIPREQEGQEENGSETADHSSAQKPTVGPTNVPKPPGMRRPTQPPKANEESHQAFSELEFRSPGI